MYVSNQNKHGRRLIEKLEARQAVVGILGMGYVGQPLALRYSQLGYKVLGFDIVTCPFFQGHS